MSLMVSAMCRLLNLLSSHIDKKIYRKSFIKCVSFSPGRGKILSTQEELPIIQVFYFFSVKQIMYG